jgi:hypothetical protein
MSSPIEIDATPLKPCNTFFPFGYLRSFEPQNEGMPDSRAYIVWSPLELLVPPLAFLHNELLQEVGRGVNRMSPTVKTRTV